MQISELLQGRKIEQTNGPNSERAALIKDFLERLNAERQGTKWKSLSARAVAIKVGHLKTPELYQFYSQCKDSRSGFSRCFFGSLKVRK